MANFNQRITTAINDGTWAGSWFPNGASWLLVGWNTFTTHEHYSGLRFLNVTVPQGATILSATITLTADDTRANAVNTKMVGIAEDSTSDMSTDPIGRSETSANTVKNFPSGTTAGNTYQWDVTAIVQEIVNRGGWGSGANMGFKLRNNSGTGSNIVLTFKSRQQDSTKSALLDITYQDPVGQVVITKSLTYAVRKSHAITKLLRYVIRDMEADPVPFSGLKVAKPDHNALNTNKPESFNYHSDHGTLKYFTSGSGSVNVNRGAGELYTITTTINHNLGYFPYVEVYAKDDLMPNYQPLGRLQIGSGAYRSFYFYVTKTQIVLIADGWTGVSGANYTVNFYYKIFKNNLGL